MGLVMYVAIGGAVGSIARYRTVPVAFRANGAPFVIPSERSESRNLTQAARLRFLAALGMTGSLSSERAQRVEESQSLWTA